MVVKILVGLVVVVGVLIVVVATRADTFHVERSVDIAAPPERAYSQVVDVHQRPVGVPEAEPPDNSSRVPPLLTVVPIAVPPDRTSSSTPLLTL